jgi:hypothetical protein
VLAVTLLGSGRAWADDDDEEEEADEDDRESSTATVTVRFWAFSSNPEFYAYQTTNHLDEEAFFVGQVDNPDPVYTEAATEDRGIRDILISREVRDRYGWNADGAPGNPSPSGFTEILVLENGPVLQVTARQGRASNPLGTINRLATDTGAFAEYSIRDVYWSPEETVAVVVLHQEVGGAWPLEVDTAHGFRVPERPEEPAPTPTPPPTE